MPFPFFIAFCFCAAFAIMAGMLRLDAVWFPDPPKFPHRIIQWDEPPVVEYVPVTLDIPCPATNAPVWCPNSGRWRDPVTKRFVKAPQRMEARAHD